MKGIVLRSLLFFSTIFLSIHCFAGAGTPFDQIIFFGDSLSDNGNLYSADFGYLPKSPPYFEGRFSNGFVWSEYAAEYFTEKNVTSTNFAIGGETAVLHNPANGYLPYSLTASINSYLLRNIIHDHSSTLFIIWIGSNDYLHGNKNVDDVTNEVITSITSSIERLISHGAMNFLLINLPDFSKIPIAKQDEDYAKILKESAEQHNTKLQIAVNEIAFGYKNVNIQLFDLNSLFVDMLKNIKIYNEKYHLNIVNTTDSCWPGGYSLQPNAIDEEKIYQELVLRKNLKPKLSLSTPITNPLDERQFAHAITLSPALREAYLVGLKAEEGEEACKNPDQYIYWDHVHPTAVVHKILGEYLINFINDHFEVKTKSN